jgi:PDZ domain-containing protein
VTFDDRYPRTVDETKRQLPPLPVILIGVLFVVATFGVVAWNVELPYLAFSAGPASDAADLVVAEGVEVYPPDGELLMLTVVTQDVNIFEAIIAGVDPTIDLVRKQAVRRADESDEEYRNRVLQQMDDSNFRSISVALDYLEIEMITTDIVINEIVEGVPAESVLQPGDSIRAISGSPVLQFADLAPLLEGTAVGDVLLMTIGRGDEILEVEVMLAERDDEPGVPMIGVILGELTESPFPLRIESGDVGGPSAGMMYALAIIDSLTPGELTHGLVIAGTGTIQIDGTVGSIGGIRQKVVGAEAAGATHILVPEGNYESALTAESTSIQIVPIGSIENAISFLENLEAA